MDARNEPMDSAKKTMDAARSIVSKYRQTDLIVEYLRDIRNMKPLDGEAINNIRNMSDGHKMDLIITMNEMVEYMKSVMEE